MKYHTVTYDRPTMDCIKLSPDKGYGHQCRLLYEQIQCSSIQSLMVKRRVTDAFETGPEISSNGFILIYLSYIHIYSLTDGLKLSDFSPM